MVNVILIGIKIVEIKIFKWCQLFSTLYFCHKWFQFDNMNKIEPYALHRCIYIYKKNEEIQEIFSFGVKIHIFLFFFFFSHTFGMAHFIRKRLSLRHDYTHSVCMSKCVCNNKVHDLNAFLGIFSCSFFLDALTPHIRMVGGSHLQWFMMHMAILRRISAISSFEWNETANLKN